MHLARFGNPIKPDGSIEIDMDVLKLLFKVYAIDFPNWGRIHPRLLGVRLVSTLKLAKLIFKT
jgi:hypothetical protein